MKAALRPGFARCVLRVVGLCSGGARRRFGGAGCKCVPGWRGEARWLDPCATTVLDDKFMRMTKMFKPACLCAGLLLLNFGPLARASVTFTSSTSWTCPVGLTSVQVQCWGGGGAGGSSTNNSSSGGGGGGGAYSEGTVAVVPGSVYAINVGAGGVATGALSSTGGTGGDSYFTNAATSTLLALAKGGGGGGNASGDGGRGAGGAGGASGSGVGAAKYSGGAGGGIGQHRQRRRRRQ